MVITVVGSGGKTTRIFELAKAYREQGKTVFVTTTTHMGGMEDTLYTDDPKEIRAQLEDTGFCMAGVKDVSKEGTVKITSLSDATLREVAEYADVTLIEGDGSARLPVKFPAEHEPVIPEYTDEIHVVVGLSAIGKRCKDVAHRLPLVMQCLQIEEMEKLRPEHLQKLVTEGYLNPLRKKYPSAKVICTPGQVNTLFEKAVAEFLREEQDVSLLNPDWFSEKPKLVICGCGHVGNQVAKIGKLLDFHVIVVDNRPEFANKTQIPEADQIHVIDFEKLSEVLPAYEDAYYVVVTSGHEFDYICVEQILRRPHKYLGLMGSKGKRKMVFGRLEEQGFDEEQIASIYTPIGLSIGAVTPAEIAVSIGAELIQVRSKVKQKAPSVDVLECKESGTLCVITKKWGSSPGLEGSMMFVKQDGSTLGTVGGGSLEALVTKSAQNMKQVLVETYHMKGQEKEVYPQNDSKNPQTNEENNKIDKINVDKYLQMVCGGTNQILFVPIFL